MLRSNLERQGITRVGGGLAALLVALSGCAGDAVEPTGGSDERKTPGVTARSPAPDGAASPGGTLGRAVPMAHRQGPAHVEVVALNRTSATTVTGRFKVVNDGRTGLDLSISLFEGGRGADSSSLVAGGIGLLDGRGSKLYMPLSTTDHTCLCSSLAGTTIGPGESVDVHAVFPAPPPDVRRVTVTMPLTVPVQDVPITDGPLRPAADQTIDPASVDLAPPRVLSVHSRAEGDERSVDEDADGRAVRLSADVLFALNKAELTPRASALLKEVAGQIDASGDTTVEVDGYTDTTGNDAINQPLSERRAKAVADRLRTLVTRGGVTFRTAGHGSADPVASNAFEEGRRKNRRVTVRFTPPPPSSPSSSATGQSSGGQPFEWTPGEAPVSGSAAFTADGAKDLRVEVNGAHRDSTGLTTVVWSVRNTGQSDVELQSAFEQDQRYHGMFSPSPSGTDGVTLLDRSAKIWYYPLRDSGGQCVCTSMSRTAAKRTLAPGESVTYAGVYRLPDEVRSVDVDFPWHGTAGARVEGVAIG
ncbi:OmpA family protein [Microbispora siamensis]|uniref:OmpA-like domain-containing protein n=1 Tax=Microbispora siamensis TaxID=564413 RepID=A0ABQ4GES7_9ACTN|nr:OmpA family protein [Microbispora siamensis]GIH59929.1 hypothetical protein Msi02_07460 [Microbispora siamensis]